MSPFAASVKDQNILNCVLLLGGKHPLILGTNTVEVIFKGFEKLVLPSFQRYSTAEHSLAFHACLSIHMGISFVLEGDTISGLKIA